MLELLHPTSAVCGMPRQASLDFIKENEGFDRKLYSGYLGPVNLLGETNLFVNLRCMSLSQKQAVIYAGAGVTADSNPEKEWQETELKCETLLNILSSYL
jgi:isochorismate synthase